MTSIGRCKGSYRRSGTALSPIGSFLLFTTALPHLAAFSSVSAVNFLGRPNESIDQLKSFSSVFASRGGGNRCGGRCLTFTSCTVGQNSHETLSTSSFLSKGSTFQGGEYSGGTPDAEVGNHTIAILDRNETSTPHTTAGTVSIREGGNKHRTIQTMKGYMDFIASSPRVRACVLMATAMSLHFGGYEFARSAALALFTSSETGFTHPSAYPFAIGLVTPTTLSLLYWYGTLLKAHGPRKALRRTTSLVLAIMLFGDGMIALLSSSAFSPGSMTWVTKAVVALLFVFQNSYAHLIYTQQWSFLGSVMTPTEGTRWFTFIAGLSSMVCTFTASSVQSIADRHLGLVILVFLTCATLSLSMLCADRAYQLSTEHGFDPSDELQAKQSKKDSEKKARGVSSDAGKDENDESLLAKTGRLFQTSPTLVGLFGEVITFQSLSTVLNICFVRQLKESIPVDGDRAAFTGQFYAGVNGTSGAMQFFVLPLLRKYLEPKWVYRFLPMLLMPLLTYAAVLPSSANTGLWVAAAAFFALKSADYSVRGVATELVYQPLDFDARYLGKEVIGVFANRFGKSGTSMILSGLTGIGFLAKGTQSMSQLAVGVGGLWTACSFYLSKQVVTNQQAEEKVKERSARATVIQASEKETTEGKRTKEE